MNFDKKILSQIKIWTNSYKEYQNIARTLDANQIFESETGQDLLNRHYWRGEQAYQWLRSHLNAAQLLAITNHIDK